VGNKSLSMATRRNLKKAKRVLTLMIAEEYSAKTPLSRRPRNKTGLSYTLRRCNFQTSLLVL
jgi:hypothetical protein